MRSLLNICLLMFPFAAIQAEWPLRTPKDQLRACIQGLVSASQAPLSIQGEHGEIPRGLEGVRLDALIADLNSLASDRDLRVELGLSAEVIQLIRELILPDLVYRASAPNGTEAFKDRLHAILKTIFREPEYRGEFAPLASSVRTALLVSLGRFLKIEVKTPEHRRAALHKLLLFTSQPLVSQLNSDHRDMYLDQLTRFVVDFKTSGHRAFVDLDNQLIQLLEDRLTNFIAAALVELTNQPEADFEGQAGDARDLRESLVSANVSRWSSLNHLSPEEAERLRGRVWKNLWELINDLSSLEADFTELKSGRLEGPTEMGRTLSLIVSLINSSEVARAHFQRAPRDRKHALERFLWLAALQKAHDQLDRFSEFLTHAILRAPEARRSQLQIKIGREISSYPRELIMYIRHVEDLHQFKELEAYLVEQAAGIDLELLTDAELYDVAFGVERIGLTAEFLSLDGRADSDLSAILDLRDEDFQMIDLESLRFVVGQLETAASEAFFVYANISGDVTNRFRAMRQLTIFHRISNVLKGYLNDEAFHRVGESDSRDLLDQLQVGERTYFPALPFASVFSLEGFEEREAWILQNFPYYINSFEDSNWREWQEAGVISNEALFQRYLEARLIGSND